jgi:uncharacterized protein (DUF1015 family)
VQIFLCSYDWSYHIMAEVRPLRALRYAADRVNLTQVITPPYDVINPQGQARYYERSPYNSIRLELGKEEIGDTTLNTVYTRAAATLAEWRFQGILQQDETASYYLYQQKFAHNGQHFTRTSLLARVRLEPWDARVILPHENTLAKAKDDRLKLYRACATNFSPIMCLYEDPQGRMRRLLSSYTPELQIIDEAGEEHLLHPITDTQQIALIQDFFAQRQLYIADGHHRYETALAYQREMAEQRRGLHSEDAVNFTLMALIDVDDPGMLVLPTHRLLVNWEPEAFAVQLSNVTDKLSTYFTIQTLQNVDTSQEIQSQLLQAGQQGTALVLRTKAQTLLLTPNEQGMERMESSGHSTAWNALDVAIAQKLLFEDVLGLDAEMMTAGTHVRYTHDAQAALNELQNGDVRAVVFLNGTPLQQVCDVAKVDDRMPQKSTYLYPKLITGLIMNPLW